MDETTANERDARGGAVVRKRTDGGSENGESLDEATEDGRDADGGSENGESTDGRSSVGNGMGSSPEADALLDDCEEDRLVDVEIHYKKSFLIIRVTYLRLRSC